LIGARRQARAAWGDLDPAMFPGTPPSCKVLEIFLYGGLSPWETFYHQAWRSDPWFGGPSFDVGAAIAALDWQECSGGPTPGTETLPFAEDSAGNTVHLGPFTKPLWQQHILDRMRTIVVSHDLPPHEAAIPLAMTGRRLGNPDLSGLGAAVQHHWAEADPRPQPYSYVIAPTAVSFNDNVAAATAVGSHPALSRPLMLKIGSGGSALLARLGRPARPQADALWSAMREQYVDQTRYGVGGPVTRSAAVAAYEASAVSVLDAAQLGGLLQSAPLVPGSETSCVDSRTPHFTGVDTTTASIRTAVQLLTDPAAEARYVCVIDNGLLSVMGNTGYDTHSEGGNPPFTDHVRTTAINLWNLLTELAASINGPNENSPDKLHLDDVVILLNTEFGRRPDPVGTGRDHWPYGYTNVLIGGPVNASTGQPKVVGAINDGGAAVETFGPADVHCAVLLAAGINPFAPNNFNQGAISMPLKANNDIDAALNIADTLLVG
jgi:hypothetical protein